VLGAAKEVATTATSNRIMRKVLEKARRKGA
jgi:hypothetical protein